MIDIAAVSEKSLIRIDWVSTLEVGYIQKKIYCL